jgi:hypothetical protein
MPPKGTWKLVAHSLVVEVNHLRAKALCASGNLSISDEATLGKPEFRVVSAGCFLGNNGVTV